MLNKTTKMTNQINKKNLLNKTLINQIKNYPRMMKKNWIMNIMIKLKLEKNKKIKM